MTIFGLGAAKGPRRGTKPPATVRGRYICLRAIDARRDECDVAHEKPQVQKADPSRLRVNLSYRGVRQLGCSVTRFWGNSDGARKSTARNVCATGGAELSPGAEAQRCRCSTRGLKPPPPKETAKSARSRSLAGLKPGPYNFRRRILAMPTVLRSYDPRDFAALYRLDQSCFPAGIAYSKATLR